MTDKVRIYEVGPRDGLQNETARVPTARTARGREGRPPTDGGANVSRGMSSRGDDASRATATRDASSLASARARDDAPRVARSPRATGRHAATTGLAALARGAIEDPRDPARGGDGSAPGTPPDDECAETRRWRSRGRGAPAIVASSSARAMRSVSYTHLTLPTIYSV